ncbi:fused response regulator/phosphatase [bacterium]|nr:fused response regulator/phosphatase [bacterium]MBU1990561.1 fused response regulator/phosphatase [bacterium]
MSNNTALEYAKSLKLLCITDNMENKDFYSAVFEELIPTIFFANESEDILQIFSDNDSDLILLDYTILKTEDLNLVQKIRKTNKSIPIILVSDTKDADILIRALNLNVTHFIKKPLQIHELLNIIGEDTKNLISNRYIQDKQHDKMEILEQKDKYSLYQEDLAFQKELNILRNDYYYQMIDSKCSSLVDLLYKPLDIISGDSYSARKIDKNTTLYLIVDGMGKGLSASLSSMLMTSYINHTVDKMKKNESFNFYSLIEESIEYIRPILLEEEALAIDYILIDSLNDTMEYSKFAMPVALLQDTHYKITKVKSNNPPLSKYTDNFKLSKISTADIFKFLFYSDGLVECDTYDNEKTYASFIEEDFLDSFTKEELKEKLFERITAQEDDITLIFINSSTCTHNVVAKKSFESTLESVDEANEWYEQEWNLLNAKNESRYKSGVVFTELFMNAYEHGNLGIGSIEKNALLENDTYFDTLQKMEKTCSKKITVSINKVHYKASTYISTQITDEGDGFDTQILSTIFRNSHTFNGRGVFVSRQSSLGIYYNSKGNSVLYLNKI